MIGEKLNRFCEQLLVRNTGITLIHVLNGIQEIESNLAALILKYVEQMVRRHWKLRLIYLMRTPGEDMRLQWTFWNLINISGVAGSHILGDHIVVKDIQEYSGSNKWERLEALVEKEHARLAPALRIVCVCTGNVDRSPLVEAYLRRELEQIGLAGAIAVESRGILPREGRPASPPTVRLASELGVDLGAHRARRLSRQDVIDADLILAMKDKHYRAILKMDPSAADRTMVLNIDDPATELYLWEDSERYRDVLIQVRNAVRHFLGNLGCTIEVIRANLQREQFQKQLAILDHYEELSSHSLELQDRALLIADNALWERGKITQPPFFPQQAMGIIALSLLASVGQAQFAETVTRNDGVFLLRRIPRLTPPW
jgi:protein-tyrosine-phosphatase